ncbi:DUF4304 domain-containing protein [Flavobacterium sp. 17A]|uniref:DUF4304 domain-containing protein n=1 Tax=Flavobacterium potami TaxID=2872310 RepID=A0A9X1H6T8_9FLAO|nr:DUF4304 domain-containing protein [Flavobacterium potami]MBZ4033182.1 DUF4304 domain-containing protein [Flavobacterium potami]
MNAKEKQLEFIKSYLKPTLKNLEYKTSGQTWWKDKGDFYTLINLQNFSWNTKDRVNFLLQYSNSSKIRNERCYQKASNI